MARLIGEEFRLNETKILIFFIGKFHKVMALFRHESFLRAIT